MSESDRRSQLLTPLFVLAMVGGGWYFFRNFEIEGLDQVSVYQKHAVDDQQFVSLGQAPSFAVLPGDAFSSFSSGVSGASSTLTPHSSGDQTRGGIFDTGSRAERGSSAIIGPNRRRDASRSARVPNLRVGSWALNGLGSGKLSNEEIRRNLVRVIRQFDMVALQQLSASERDLVPLLVDAVNAGPSDGEDRHYDFVIGKPSGPSGSREQLAFIFDSGRIRVDRSQTYTVADPDDRMTYDPLVGWFQAAEPRVDSAWTFSVANIRIDLGHAPDEVALLPSMLRAIRYDGRGEDDVVMVGLLQADDAYLIPDVMGDRVSAAVVKTATEVIGKHQTSNILVDVGPTTEYVGRGGALDFLRIYNLSLEAAQAVSSQLPVYAEFSATEGGVPTH